MAVFLLGGSHVFAIQLMFLGKQLKTTVILAVTVRVALILLLSTYESVYDHQLAFTDIDYKVYSDAALEENPYNRHTYRYTPLIAYLNAFNYTHHQTIGKLIFTIFDAIAIVLLYLIIRHSDPSKRSAERHASLLAKMYAYNPLFIALTVRGSCESITLALMYAFWYFYFGAEANGSQAGLLSISNKIADSQPNWKMKWVSYLVYGLWVHVRVYPIILLPLLLAQEYQTKGKSWSRVMKLFLELGVGAGGVFLGLGALFYYLYGSKFLQESYLYHWTRRDHRHSFSAYFYEIYLTYSQDIGSASRSFIRAIPTIYILLSISNFVRGYSPFYLHFLLTFCFVAFNRVITLQYYMWVLGALMLCLPESLIFQQNRFRMGWGLLLQWALPIMVWIWLSIGLEGEGENHLHLMWMICLFQLYMHLWVLFSFMKTEKKRKFEEARKLLSGKQD